MSNEMLARIKKINAMLDQAALLSQQGSKLIDEADKLKNQAKKMITEIRGEIENAS